MTEQLENTNPLVSNTENRNTEKVLTQALEHYLEQIKPLGIVNEVIIGVPPNEPPQLFTVVKDQISEKTTTDPRYDILEDSFADLEISVKDIIRIYAFYVYEGDLKGFLDDCSDKGIEINRIKLTDTQ